jgi:hypothetical protein
MMRARAFRANQPQIVAIFAFRQGSDNPFELRLIDEVHPVGHFFQARDLQSLPMLDRRDVISRFEQAGLRPRVEPRHSATQWFYMELVLLKIERIQIRDLEFLPRRGTKLPAEFDHAFVVNIQSRDREIAFRMLRFFLEAPKMQAPR